MARVCRVLVVEDNEDIRALLSDFFEHEGYRLTLAANGGEMRRTLSAGDVDVVLIDVHLQTGEDGLALAKEAAAAGCAVVMTTGDHHQVARLEASQHRYILKPYRLDALIATIEAALEAARADCEVKSRIFSA